MFKNNQKIEKLITAMDCKIDRIEDDMISLDDGLWHIVIHEDHPNDIFLYLHVAVIHWAAADIATRLSLLANSVGMNVVIHDVYAFEFDEAGDIVDMTFGDDAHETSGRTHYFGLCE